MMGLDGIGWDNNGTCPRDNVGRFLGSGLVLENPMNFWDPMDPIYPSQWKIPAKNRWLSQPAKAPFSSLVPGLSRTFQPCLITQEGRLASSMY